MTVDERFDRIDASIERLGQALESLTRYTLDFREETARQFEIMDNRLNVLAATMANVEVRLAPLTKAAIDAGAVASKVLREQWHTRISRPILTPA